MKLFSLRPFFCPRGLLFLIVSFWKNRFFYFLQPHFSDVPQMGCLTWENEYSSYTMLPFELGPGPEGQNGPRPHKTEQGKSFWTKPGSSSHLYFPLCPVTSLLPSEFLENNIFSDVLCEGWGLSGLHQRLTYNTPLKKKKLGCQMSLENTVDYICLSVHIYESALWNSTVKETCCGTTFSLASPRLIGRELSIPINIPWLFWFLSTFSLQGCVPPKCVETGELSYSYTTFHVIFPRNFSLFALWSYKLSFCLCAVLTDCSFFLCRPVRGKLTEWNTNQDPFPLAESLLLPVQSLLPNQ